MRWTFLVAIALGGLLGGWMLFDGLRASIAGDFTTGTGQHSGRLGPWADLLRALGVEPRSAAVKVAHVALGVGWLAAAAGLAFRAAWARWAALGLAVASLWYLPAGTVIGTVVIVLALTSLR